MKILLLTGYIKNNSTARKRSHADWQKTPQILYHYRVSIASENQNSYVPSLFAQTALQRQEAKGRKMTNGMNYIIGKQGAFLLEMHPEMEKCTDNDGVSKISEKKSQNRLTFPKNYGILIKLTGQPESA